MCMEVNDRQVGGDHYRMMAYQPWDLSVALKLDFLRGNVLKYLARYRSAKDAHKALHYIDKIIEAEWDNPVINDFNIAEFQSFANQCPAMRRYPMLRDVAYHVLSGRADSWGRDILVKFINDMRAGNE